MRLRDVRHCGYGHLQDPVLASHRSASFRDLRHSCVPDPQVVKTYRRRHNVDDRIDRPHFVEVHFIDGYAVRLGFRLRQDLKDTQRQGPGSLSHLKVSDDLPDLSHSCVVMTVPVVMVVVMVMMIVIMMMVMMKVVIMVMIMVMAVGMGVLLSLEVSVQVLHVVVVPVVLLIEDHIEVTAVYARFLHSADLHLKAMSGNSLQDLQELLLIRSKIEKRGYSHVAADTGPAFQIKDLITVLHPIYFLHRPGG